MATIKEVEWDHIKETWLGYECTKCFCGFPFIEGALAHDSKSCNE